jgi:hypothetical protein
MFMSALREVNRTHDLRAYRIAVPALRNARPESLTPRSFVVRIPDSEDDRRMRSIFPYQLFIAATLAAAIACGGKSNDGSALCGINGANSCHQGEQCSSTLGCVQCVANTDCAAANPRCVEGQCQECATNADCPAAMPACYADNQCHPKCGSNADCQQLQQGLDICDTTSGACIGCTSNTDCAGTQNPRCDTTTLNCVACLSNADCGAAAPFCFLGDHQCVQCTSNANCPAAQPICGRDLQCRDGCTTNAQCAGQQGTPICDTASSQCVECLVNTDCGSAAPICGDQNQCVVCVMNSDCKGSAAPICDQQRNQGMGLCVQCVRNSDCGSAMPNCNNNVCGP